MVAWNSHDPLNVVNALKDINDNIAATWWVRFVGSDIGVKMIAWHHGWKHGGAGHDRRSGCGGQPARPLATSEREAQTPR